MEHNKLRSPFQAEEVENNWAISYGDMITLLLGFFVIFFNIKSETVNLNLVKKDLDKYFESAKSEESGRSVAQVQDKKNFKNTPLLTTDISNRLQIKSNLEGERILVEFPGISFFKSASHDLTKEGKLALSDFSSAIDQHLGLFRLVVRGYTDALPLNPRSKYKDNLELSAFRSISAIRYLANQGISLENMRIAGYGESSVNRSERDKKELQNQRKVVIVIEPLDHTERVSVKVKTKVPDHAVGIEEVVNAEVPSREISSMRDLSSLDKIMVEVQKRLPNPEPVILALKKQSQKINKKISENEKYKSIIDYFVGKKLKAKGYSDEQVKNALRKKEGRVNK